MQNRPTTERVPTPPMLVEQESQRVAFFCLPFKAQWNEQHHHSNLRIVNMDDVLASNCAEGNVEQQQPKGKGELVNMVTNSNKRLAQG